ncbi:hypothetical protein [Allocoleopsis sp.]|uniref:hypothetical protein n=1 Tax=Allocoleopsis sp. TaxID=3088169 RepID=UPI002FD5C956
MITTRVCEYQFENCNLQLIGEKLFHVKIISQSPRWELVTAIPKTCPFEALMLAELEILKAQVKSEVLNAACIVQVSRGMEKIVGFNRTFKVFSQENLKASAQDLTEYNKVLQLVKSEKKHTHLQLISQDGCLTNFSVALKKSSVSVVNWLLCRAVTKAL